ncbi:MAG: hypothetical protein WA705_00280 [Candidatus Ozemobacteraceae bacterium]
MEAERGNPLALPTGEYKTETHCPSCGRFVGISERCPYCRALTRKRLSIRVFKVIAVLTSTIGLAILLFFAQTIKTPEVKINQLGPLSNFAHVRIIGTVDRSYGVHPQWKSLSFTVQQPDSMGEPCTIRVFAYAKTVVEIEKSNKVPMDGDQISVDGQVRFQKDSPSLLVNAPEHISIIKRAEDAAAEKPPLEPGKVAAEHVGKIVTVKGAVGDVVGFPRGMLIRLEDGGQGLAVWIPSKLADDLNMAIQAGDLVLASGKVKPYKDSLEIEVFTQTGFKVISKGKGGPSQELPPAGRESEGTVEEAAMGSGDSGPSETPESFGGASETGLTASSAIELPCTSLASITKEMAGQAVRVVGVLNKIVAYKTGVKLIVADGSALVAVWMPNEISAGLPIPTEGAKLSVEGVVAVYKDEIQIQPRDAGDMSVLP